MKKPLGKWSSKGHSNLFWNEEPILFRGQIWTKNSTALSLCHYLSIYTVSLIYNNCKTWHCSTENGKVWKSLSSSTHGLWISHVMRGISCVISLALLNLLCCGFWQQQASLWPQTYFQAWCWHQGVKRRRLMRMGSLPEFSSDSLHNSR